MYKKEIPADYISRQARRFEPIYTMQSDNIEHHHQSSEILKLEEALKAERERYHRLAADFDNYRKRTVRESEQRASSHKEALVRDILPSIDNLERALAANSGENLREGVQMIYQQFVESLKRHGFEPRDDFGQPFDGRFHDAIAVGCKKELPDLSVIEVWERGWMRGHEMFRPAKVLVNKLESEFETQPAQDTDEEPALANI